MKIAITTFLDPKYVPAKTHGRKPKQLKDGDTIYVKNGEIIREVCCQCGLAHLVKYEIKEKQ